MITNGPVLTPSHIFIAVNQFIYALDYAGNSAANPIGQITVEAQMVWSRVHSVLYVLDNSGILYAKNTMDPLDFTPMWSINTGVAQSRGAGPSISLDGTIYIGGASGSATKPVVVALGCIDGKSLLEDGTCGCTAGQQSYQGMCVTCAANEFFDSVNGCSTCADGTILNGAKNGCVSCPANTFSTNGNTQCRACVEQPSNAQCDPSAPNNSNGPNAGPGSRFSNGSLLDFAVAALVTVSCAVFVMLYN